jgi:hypothetical protein
MSLLLGRENKLRYPSGYAPWFDPTHPAAKGVAPLNGLSAIAGPAGTFIDILTEHTGVTTSGAGLPPYKISGRVGPSLDFNPANFDAITKFTGNSTANVPGCTYGIIVDYGTGTINTSGDQGLVGCNTATPNYFMWSHFGFLRQIGGGGINASGPMGLATGGAFFMAISTGLTGSKTNFCTTNLLTGQIQVESDTGNFGASVASDGTYFVGNLSSINKETLGKISCAMYAPNYLSLAHLAQWAADPWSFWYPASPLVVNLQDPDDQIVGSAISSFTWMQGDEESIIPISHFKREAIAHD